MNNFGPWTSDDYEMLSWHDVHVHGFRLENFKQDNGSADLVLDIDYVLKWDKRGKDFIFQYAKPSSDFTTCLV
jgi:hypothetical protein